MYRGVDGQWNGLNGREVECDNKNCRWCNVDCDCAVSGCGCVMD